MLANPRPLRQLRRLFLSHDVSRRPTKAFSVDRSCTIKRLSPKTSSPIKRESAPRAFSPLATFAPTFRRAQLAPSYLLSMAGRDRHRSGCTWVFWDRDVLNLPTY